MATGGGDEPRFQRFGDEPGVALAGMNYAVGVLLRVSRADISRNHIRLRPTEMWVMTRLDVTPLYGKPAAAFSAASISSRDGARRSCSGRGTLRCPPP